MGTCYYAVCHECKKYIDLDKFYGWATYNGADPCTIDKVDLADYKKDGWIYRALRLHIFLYAHNGHKLGVYSEHEAENVSSEHESERDKLEEQYPWPSGLKYLTEQIDMSPSIGRLIITTRFGDIVIDDRGSDINCFRFVDGERIDTQLLKNSDNKPNDDVSQPAVEADAQNLCDVCSDPAKGSCGDYCRHRGRYLRTT